MQADSCDLRSLVEGSLAVAQDTPEQGRYLASRRNVRPGEVIMRSLPYAVAVSDQYKKGVCSHCMKAFTQSQKEKKRIVVCPKGCGEASFCSSKCLEENPNSPETRHYELECRVLRTMHAPKWKNVDMSIFRLLLKILARRAHEEGTSKSQTLEEHSERVSFGYVGNLVSHFQRIKEGEGMKLTQAEEVNSKFADALMANLGARLLFGIDKEAMLDLISKIECNQFGIWGKKGTLYGRGLYLNCTLFNHSCIPNCVRVQEGRNIAIRAFREIPEGVELTISYIDLDISTTERQNLLQEHYFFRCCCPRCCDTTEASDGFIYRFMCRSKECNGFVVPLDETDQETRVCAACRTPYVH